MEIESREIEIIKLILEHKVMTVSQIANWYYVKKKDS